jgi:thiol-disulfide isomerase/thioredoxin
VDSREAFAEAISTEKLTIVDFFVPWCVACRRFHPALVKLAAKHPDCVFLAVGV